MKKIILAAIALVACFAAAHAAPRKAAGVQERPKLMWFDLSANWARFSSADSIEYYVEKCREGLVHTDFLRTVFVGFPVDSERKN